MKMLKYCVPHRFLLFAQHSQTQRCMSYKIHSEINNLKQTGTTVLSSSPSTHQSSSSSSDNREIPLKARKLCPRPNSLTDEIIRVDHAGELGADRIYAGQMAILGNGPMGKTIAHMWEQEKCHRKQFEELIQQHRVRPTIMTPVWNVAGFALGAGSALMGEKAAMACTVAVETVIVEHYNDQLRQIMESPNPDQELLKTITKFRDEEQEHHDTGIECGAEQAPFYKAMTEVIKMGCKIAIAISKRI